MIVVFYVVFLGKSFLDVASSKFWMQPAGNVDIRVDLPSFCV